MVEILNNLLWLAAGVVTHLIDGVSLLPFALSSIVL